MSDPWSTCCPKCAAQIRPDAPVCWMCGHPFRTTPGGSGASSPYLAGPAPDVYAASTASADGAHALWVIGALGVGILTLGIFLGVAVFSPGLAVIFALIAVPILVALYRFSRQAAAKAQRETPAAPASPVDAAARIVLVVAIALGGAFLLFVAGIVVFFMICAASIHLH